MASGKKNNLHSNYSLHAIANVSVALVWTLIVAVGESTQPPYSSIIPIAFFIAALVFVILEISNKQDKKQKS